MRPGAKGPADPGGAQRGMRMAVKRGVHCWVHWKTTVLKITLIQCHRRQFDSAPGTKAPFSAVLFLDAAALGEYVGKYRFSFGILDVALKSGHLEAQLMGQPAVPIFANAKDKFFYKIVDAQLDFERDAGGKVITVVLHQNGRDMRASRITTDR